MSNRIQELRAPDGEAPLLRDGPWLSENARRIYQEMIGVDWFTNLKLADAIDDSTADLDDTPVQEHLYENFPHIVDTAIDLFNMVSRRDENIVALEAEIERLRAGLPEDGEEVRF